jgi:hypothetical protein
MNPRSVITVVTLLGVSWTSAQQLQPDSQEDPVVAAIREFNRRDSNQPNEVTVVLDPPAENGEPAPALSGLDKETPTPKAILVTGKPQIDIEPEPAEAKELAAAPPPAEPPHEEPTPQPKKGLNVRVVNVQSGSQHIDPQQVKLLAPFPAKPLAQAPAGWHFETSEAAPPFTRDVELAPGSTITLTVRPHILVPDTDGVRSFNIQEPGFNNALGYRQTDTVGAILSNSLREMDEDAKKLGVAIDQLQQLLVSLPKPESDSAAQPAPAHP